jgi:hypothetical protein
MKPRPAVTLALLGWYLITPHSLPNGRLDESAPLGHWDRQDSCASSEDCENARKHLLNLEAGRGTTPSN